MDPRDKLVAAFVLSLACYFAFATESSAESAASFFRPLVFDTSPQTYVINGQRYAIPRNFYPGPQKTKDGVSGRTSMRFFAPDMTGLTQQDVPCLDNRSPCHHRGIVVGLMANEIAGGRRFQIIRESSFPDARNGPCGLEYYESKGPPAHRHVYFFRHWAANSDVSILRCQKINGELRGLCNSSENVGDGNRFYFVMDVKNLCEWQEIRNKIVERIGSFKKAEIEK